MYNNEHVIITNTSVYNIFGFLFYLLNNIIVWVGICAHCADADP